MKKVACAVLIFIMVNFLIKPLSGDASSGHSGVGYSGHGYSGSGYGRSSYSGRFHWVNGYWRGGHWVNGYWGWWAPWAVIGGAAVLASYYYSPYYDSYYYSPYYEPVPVADQGQPPVYAQPAPSAPPSTVERIFIYPRKGQSEELKAKDRYECHRWGVSQTGYDPTQTTPGMSGAQLNQLRADYQRAMSACLDGRGYTMK